MILDILYRNYYSCWERNCQRKTLVWRDPGHMTSRNGHVSRMEGEHMEDRRVQRTRQLLEQALLELIEEQNYESITVQQITDRANMGRATFYLHYREKEQLLLTTVQKLQEDLAQRLEPLRPPDLRTEKQTLSEKIFQHVAQYRHLYQGLMS